MIPWLNIDAGELPDEPPELYRLAHTVHVACGGHAGDAASMARVVALCKQSSTAVGAHPSYPDREHFGRRSLSLDAADIQAAVRAQCAALAAIAAEHGVPISSVKPHGALYHDAARAGSIAGAVVRGAVEALGSTWELVGPAGSALESEARARGLVFAREGFADRGMRADGSLVPRGEPGAVVTSPEQAAARAIVLARSGAVDTICVHGDTPSSLSVARAVRMALEMSQPPPADR